MARVGATEDSAPRKGSSERSSPWVNDRSQSPSLRSRPTSLSPLLGDPSNARESHTPALIFALTYCVGHIVVIQTRTGESYEGILHTTGLLNGESHFVLRKAKKMRTDEREEECWIERLVIPSEDCLQLLAKDLLSSQDSAPPPPPPRPLSSPGLPFPNSSELEHHHRQLPIRFGDFEEAGFMGDKNRERLGAGLFGRVLQRWVPEGEVGASLSDFDDSKHEVGDWDQFEENEKLFGLKTDFNMDLYTTPLRENESKYSVAEADEIAREIRNASSANLHLQEERGQLAFDDSGLNEEMLYSSVLPEATSPLKQHHQNEEGRKRDELMQTPPSTPPATSTPKALLHRSRFQPNQLIFSKNSRPMIINKGRPTPHDARKEVNKIVREISSSRAPPRGSPLRNSPLIGDPEALQALNLQVSTDMRSSQKPFLQQFKQFKTFGVKIHAENTREAQMNQFKEFSKSMEFKLLSKKALSEVRTSPESAEKTSMELESPEKDNLGKDDFTSLPNPPKESALGAQLAAAAANPPPVQEEIDLNPEGWTQKALPKLNIERRDEEDDNDNDDDGNLSSDQPNSGRGLNPHATPFNPGHGAETQFESTLMMMEDAVNGGAGAGTTTEHSPRDSPIISSPISPKFERARTPEGGRLTNPSLPSTPVEKDYPPPPPPPVLVVHEYGAPPPPNGGMTPGRMRQPPPPPPPPVPRLRTPPPPPPLPQVSEMIPGPPPPPPPVLPQGPGNYQGGGPPRPSRQIPSPGPRRPTHQGPMMEPRPPNMIMMPSSRPLPPNQAPVGQQGAAGVSPHVSNATHVPMHVMHQHLGPPPPPPPPPPYGYPPTDVNGQIPVMYQFPPPPMTPGPPPNGSGNPQTGPQPMIYPAFYPHPAMQPYAMPYGPPMMPQGPMPGQYMPMVQAQVAQPRPGPGGGGRSRKPGRRAESFFSIGPKRG